MTRYALARLLQLVPILLGVSLIVFGAMLLLPGDPALAILGPYATDENVAALREQLDLEGDPVSRYLSWLSQVVRGDFGHAYSLDRSVSALIGERLGPTLLLAGCALLLATLLGVVGGVIAAVRQGGWADHVLTTALLLGISMPSFWLALLLILGFAVWLPWFPVGGMRAVYDPGGVLDVLHHLLLPAIALAAVAAGVIGRLARTVMLEVLRQDYVLAARAKGLATSRVVLRHALRNAVVGLVPVIAVQTGFLLGGAVYVETVFQWPGIGRLLVDAVGARDLLLVQGIVLVLATLYVLANLGADLVQGWLDPRVRG